MSDPSEFPPPLPPYRPDLGDRLIKGPVMVLVGLLMHAGLFWLTFILPKPPDTWTAIAAAVCMIPYSLIATFFALGGLRAILGPRSWMDRLSRRAMGQLLAWITGASALIVVLLVFW